MVHTLRLASLIVLGLCLLTGCFADKERERLMKEQYPSYPELIKRAIDDGYVTRGMTYDQVYLALGPAYCRTPTYYQGKKVETWMYPPDEGMPCARARSRIYFENGQVIGWESPQSRLSENQ
jgi:outer membrane protein assembly factor BamE